MLPLATTHKGDTMSLDTKASAIQVTAAGFGSGTAVIAQHASNFSLANISGGLTIAFTLWMFGCSVYDRFQKKKGGR